MKRCSVIRDQIQTLLVIHGTSLSLSKFKSCTSSTFKTQSLSKIVSNVGVVFFSKNKSRITFLTTMSISSGTREGRWNRSFCPYSPKQFFMSSVTFSFETVLTDKPVAAAIRSTTFQIFSRLPWCISSSKYFRTHDLNSGWDLISLLKFNFGGTPSSVISPWRAGVRILLWENFPKIRVLPLYCSNTRSL